MPDIKAIKATGWEFINIIAFIFSKVVAYIIIAISINYYLYSQWKTNENEKNPLSDNYKTVFDLFLAGSIGHILRLFLHAYHQSTKAHFFKKEEKSSARQPTLTSNTKILALLDSAIDIISSILIVISINYYLYSQWKKFEPDDVPKSGANTFYATAQDLFLAGSIGYIAHMIFKALHVHNIIGKMTTTPVLDAIFSAILI